MRYALIAALALCGLVAQAIPPQNAAEETPKRKIPCKTPESAASCYRTHGRLSVYIRNPPWRMWKIGTHRLLAIFSGPSAFPPRNDQDSINPLRAARIDDSYAARTAGFGAPALTAGVR